MNANLRSKLKAWDRENRSRTVDEMVAAVEAGDVAKTRELLERRPLIEWFVPYDAASWAELAAAAGQLGLMKFWLARNAAAKKRPVSDDELLFWTMGSEYVRPRKGDPVVVAAYLLGRGASIDGAPRTNYTPLHRAVFMNRPELRSEERRVGKE